MIDVLGIVVREGEIAEIRTKLGETKEKRTLTIADDTNASIDVTLWGENVHLPIEKDMMIAFKSARISEFSGRSLNSSFDKSDIVLNIQHPEAVKVSNWYKSSSPASIKSLSGEFQGSGNDIRCSIAEMVTMLEADQRMLLDG